jgi:hypothetical protein
VEVRHMVGGACLHEHADNDPEESTQFRHGPTLRAKAGWFKTPAAGYKRKPAAHAAAGESREFGGLLRPTVQNGGVGSAPGLERAKRMECAGPSRRFGWAQWPAYAQCSCGAKGKR